jgi:hypothetical protein
MGPKFQRSRRGPEPIPMENKKGRKNMERAIEFVYRRLPWVYKTFLEVKP